MTFPEHFSGSAGGFKGLKIAIACPRGTKTGGPEALHQLCQELIAFGVDAYLVNLGGTKKTVEEYEKYNAPWRPEHALNHASHLVVPETMLELPSRWSAQFSGQFVLWWLSVDNCPFPQARMHESSSNPIPAQWLSKQSMRLNSKKFLDWTYVFLHRKLALAGGQSEQFEEPFSVNLKACTHIAQSIYAQRWTSSTLGMSAHLVTDYIWRDNKLVSSEPRFSEKVRKNQLPIVAYNASKGDELVRLIRRHCSRQIKFVALKKMSGERVSKVLQEANLYLDLGHFPGRDRMPREAALAKCPVLISRRGSARTYEDFPLDEDYRLALDNESPQSVARKIEEMIANRGLHLSRQKLFGDVVGKSKAEYSSQVERWVRSLLEPSGLRT